VVVAVDGYGVCRRDVDGGCDKTEHQTDRLGRIAFFVMTRLMNSEHVVCAAVAALNRKTSPANKKQKERVVVSTLPEDASFSPHLRAAGLQPLLELSLAVSSNVRPAPLSLTSVQATTQHSPEPKEGGAECDMEISSVFGYMLFFIDMLLYILQHALYHPMILGS
jgi:hypothetical protein